MPRKGPEPPPDDPVAPPPTDDDAAKSAADINYQKVASAFKELLEGDKKQMTAAEIAIEAYKARTDRILGLSDAAHTLLAAVGFPVHGIATDAIVAASHSGDLDAKVEKACRIALMAVLREVERMAEDHALDADAAPEGDN